MKIIQNKNTRKLSSLSYADHFKKTLLAAMLMPLVVGCANNGNLNAEQLVNNSTPVSVVSQNDINAAPLSELERKNIELKKEIADDFEKQAMILNMECESELLAFNDRISPPYVNESDLINLHAEAETVMNDLTQRLENNPSEELKHTFEKEIARLKLEFAIELNTQSLSSINQQKEQELDAINEKASKQYECSVKLAEAKAERDRLLTLVNEGSKVSVIYEKKINELESILEEAKVELDMVNQESFDDLLF